MIDTYTECMLSIFKAQIDSEVKRLCLIQPMPNTILKDAMNDPLCNALMDRFVKRFRSA